MFIGILQNMNSELKWYIARSKQYNFFNILASCDPKLVSYYAINQVVCGKGYIVPGRSSFYRV